MGFCSKQGFGQCAYRHSPSQLNARIGREIENRRGDLARPCDAPHRRIGIDLGAGVGGIVAVVDITLGHGRHEPTRWRSIRRELDIHRHASLDVAAGCGCACAYAENSTPLIRDHVQEMPHLRLQFRVAAVLNASK